MRFTCQIFILYIVLYNRICGQKCDTLTNVLGSKVSLWAVPKLLISTVRPNSRKSHVKSILSTRKSAHNDFPLCYGLVQTLYKWYRQHVTRYMELSAHIYFFLWAVAHFCPHTGAYQIYICVRDKQSIYTFGTPTII